MAPYKDVKSLFDLASHSLGNYIGSLTLSVLEKFHGQMNNEESRNLQEFIKDTVEYYDTKIPPFLHNIVTFYSLTHIVPRFGTDIQSIDFGPREIGSLHTSDITTPGIFDIAIRAHITKLNFSKWPCIETYLYKSLSRLEKLKLIELSNNSHFSKESKYISIYIQSMKNLQSFVCPNCNDALLEMLSNNCTLQNLDIRSYSYECSVSDASVSSILKMQSLKTLQLSHRFSVDACKRIILGLPNLIYISYRKLNQVLAQITDDIVLPLQYVEYNCYNQKDVRNLIFLCPSIIKLSVHSFYFNVTDLSHLAVLENLTSLAVHGSHGFYKEKIKLLLKARGYQITELQFTEVGEISMKTLYEISTLCPKLNTLVLAKLKVSKVPGFPTEKKKLFPNLEHLYIDIYKNSNNSVLLLFFKNCIDIKTVKFVNSEEFVFTDRKGITVENLSSVLDYNRLEHLEEFIFYSDGLTVRSILQLIDTCTQLKRIGYVRNWFNIQRSGIQQLRQYVKDNNLDVELLDKTEEHNEQASVMNIMNMPL